MAQVFYWHDIYTLGIDEIDEQHKKIVVFINRLHEGIHDGADKDALSRGLQDMIDEANSHFSYEEGLLKTHGYPDFDAHHTRHVMLEDRILDMQRRVREGQTAVSPEMTVFMKSWLSDHILRIDRKFIPYLKKA